MAATDSLFDAYRDHGMFLFRATAGGTFLFFGVAELGVGPGAWGELGTAAGVAHPAAAMCGGLASALLFAFGGALLVLGLWTRRIALALALALAIVALVRWPAVESGTLEGAAAFFYPASMCSAMVALATNGGGRFGLDAVRRAKAGRRR